MTLSFSKKKKQKNAKEKLEGGGGKEKFLNAWQPKMLHLIKNAYRAAKTLNFHELLIPTPLLKKKKKIRL